MSYTQSFAGCRVCHRSWVDRWPGFSDSKGICPPCADDAEQGNLAGQRRIAQQFLGSKKREQAIADARADGHTWKDIAAAFGISAERAREIHKHREKRMHRSPVECVTFLAGPLDGQTLDVAYVARRVFVPGDDTGAYEWRSKSTMAWRPNE